MNITHIESYLYYLKKIVFDINSLLQVFIFYEGKYIISLINSGQNTFYNYQKANRRVPKLEDASFIAHVLKFINEIFEFFVVREQYRFGILEKNIPSMKYLPPIKGKKVKSSSLDTKNSTKTKISESIKHNNSEFPPKIIPTKNNPSLFLTKDLKTPSFTRIEPEKKAALKKKISDISLIQLKKPQTPLLIKDRQKPSQSLHIKSNVVPLKATIKL